MSFSDIDWSIEKTKLEFKDRKDPRISLIRQRWPGNPQNKNSASTNTLTSMHYAGETLAQSFATPSANGKFIDLTLEFAPGVEESDFLRKSLLRVSLLRLEETISNQPALIRLMNSEIAAPAELKQLGFARDGQNYLADIDSAQANLRVSIKNLLREYMKSAPKVGRGFLLDAEKLDQAAVLALNHEYGDLAWGTTNWARHSSISNDELQMIERLPSAATALEVGAGSGRVTEALVGRFDHIVATDIVEETLSHVRRLGPCVTPVIDDILNTKLASNFFDVVMFWENGFGAINSLDLRKKAFSNMASLTKPGGRLIIAVRQLLPVSVDHLMVAAQTDLVMGIYHTFSDQEMRSYAFDGLWLEKIIVGDERPAGGIQKFFVYRKDPV